MWSKIWIEKVLKMTQWWLVKWRIASIHWQWTCSSIRGLQTMTHISSPISFMIGVLKSVENWPISASKHFLLVAKYTVCILSGVTLFLCSSQSSSLCDWKPQRQRQFDGPIISFKFTRYCWETQKMVVWQQHVFRCTCWFIPKASFLILIHTKTYFKILIWSVQWLFPGKQFTAGELQEILTEAGFKDITVTHTYGYYSIVSGTKP
jgi:hypothetical protein